VLAGRCTYLVWVSLKAICLSFTFYVVVYDSCCFESKYLYLFSYYLLLALTVQYSGSMFTYLNALVLSNY